MSSYQDATSDLRKQFLGLLINLYFSIGTELSQNHCMSIGQRGMYQIMVAIKANETKELKSDYEKLSGYMKHDGAAQPNEPETYQMWERLSKYLNEHQFSELYMGLIQTSSLPSGKEAPSNTPIPSNLPATLR